MEERRIQPEKIKKICKIVGGAGLVGLLGAITTGIMTDNYKYDIFSYAVGAHSLMASLYAGAIYGQLLEKRELEK